MPAALDIFKSLFWIDNQFFIIKNYQIIGETRKILIVQKYSSFLYTTIIDMINIIYD